MREQGAPIAHLRRNWDRLERSFSPHRTHQHEIRVRKYPLDRVRVHPSIIVQGGRKIQRADLSMYLFF